MKTIIASLSDLIKMLSDAFRLSALFPALFFVLLNWIFVFTRLARFPLFDELTGQDLKDLFLIAGALALLLGYTLEATKRPIIRLYEGYPWRDTWLGEFLIGWQRGHMDWLIKQKQEREKDLVDKLNLYSLPSSHVAIRQLDAQIKQCKSELSNAFPPDEGRILPTRLGNVIAAFESYPWQRYRMDGIIFWSRIFPILAEEGFAPYATHARATTEFLLNNSLLIGFFSFECILLRILFSSDIGWYLPLLGFGLALLFYKSAISSLDNWAAMFRTAFDLYRYQLADSLGLRPVESFEEERQVWHELTQFWKGQRSSLDHRLCHSKDAWPVVGSNHPNKEGEE